MSLRLVCPSVMCCCPSRRTLLSSSFFFNDTASIEIYTLSLHDALPISRGARATRGRSPGAGRTAHGQRRPGCGPEASRSEEHTSELQSLRHLVCRLLLEKNNDRNILKNLLRGSDETADPKMRPGLLVAH